MNGCVSRELGADREDGQWLYNKSVEFSVHFFSFSFLHRRDDCRERATLGKRRTIFFSFLIIHTCYFVYILYIYKYRVCISLNVCTALIVITVTWTPNDDCV